MFPHNLCQQVVYTLGSCTDFDYVCHLRKKNVRIWHHIIINLFSKQCIMGNMGLLYLFCYCETAPFCMTMLQLDSSQRPAEQVKELAYMFLGRRPNFMSLFHIFT